MSGSTKTVRGEKDLWVQTDKKSEVSYVTQPVR